MKSLLPALKRAMSLRSARKPSSRLCHRHRPLCRPSPHLLLPWCSLHHLFSCSRLLHRPRQLPRSLKSAQLFATSPLHAPTQHPPREPPTLPLRPTLKCGDVRKSRKKSLWARLRLFTRAGQGRARARIAKLGLRSRIWSGSCMRAVVVRESWSRQRGLAAESWCYMRSKLRRLRSQEEACGLKRTRKVGCPLACQSIVKGAARVALPLSSQITLGASWLTCTLIGPPPGLVRAMLATLT